MSKKLPLLVPNLPRLWRRRRAQEPQKAPALPPGSLIHVGERKMDALSVRVMEYRGDHLEEFETVEIADCLPHKGTDAITWLHVTGLHEVDKIAQLASAFEIHPLITEDVLNSRQRAKIEIYEDSVFVVAKLVLLKEQNQVELQHFCLILTESTVITFCEAPSSIFDPLIRRIRNGKGRIRNSGSDYLAWAVLDAAVDHYFGVIDGIEEALSNLDEMLQQDITSVDAAHLYATKREVASLHKLVRPLREIAVGLHRGESALLTEQSRIFFHDLYDHSIHVIENTEDLRDFASNLRDFYLTAVSNRMNEVMKVLTCVATIFMPITFLAGIYGMNFEHMPELKYPWAYPVLWIAFIGIAGAMFLLFVKKKWL